MSPILAFPPAFSPKWDRYPLGATLDGQRVDQFGIIRAHSKIGYVSLASKIPGREPQHVEFPKTEAYLRAFASLGSGYFPPIRHYYYGKVVLVERNGTPLEEEAEELFGIPE